MFNSVSEIRTSIPVISKLKNQGTNTLSANTEVKKEKQKYPYPSSALHKAYFMPYFTGTVTDITSRLEEKKKSEAEKPPKKRKSLDTEGVCVSLETETAKINGLVDQAVQIAKEAKVIDTDFSLPLSSDALAVRTAYNSKDDFKSWFTSSKGKQLFLHIKTDDKLNPENLNSYVKIPLSESNSQKLVDEVNNKFSIEDLRNLHATSPGLTDLLVNLRGLTEEDVLSWEQIRDHDRNLSFRTKYKNYNIDLMNTSTYNEEIGESVNQLSIGISKVTRSKKTEMPILIFNNIDQQEADKLDSSILHSSSYEPYMPEEQKENDIGYFKELGFLSGKTKQDKEKLAKLLESLGFERTKKCKE